MRQLPDRIETQVAQEAWIKPTGVTLALRVAGSATVGTAAAVRKSKELLAIQELMRGLEVGEDKIRIESVALAAGERWLSGSSVEIDLEIRDVPLPVASQALAGLSALKGVALKDISYEYGDLTPHRDELLRGAVTESMRQARLIADTAGLSLRAIHSMSHRWVEPNGEGLSQNYEMARGGRPMLASASAEDVRGYQLMEHHEGRLGILMRMEVRVGEFGEKG
ncbi:SIMPL domain-containing protein [Pseudomonas sp. CGJS7]|uniref:SIMPL domain-containing protein n=1 Tax=Pseudomonas sp. CGJS7 TaxID=3109348 RepID=UPI00300BB3E1